ncbi:Zinc finger, BED-type, partial [Trema orientale]
MEDEAHGLQVFLESQSIEVPRPVDVESTQLEGDSKDVKGKRRRKLTSEVWTYFDMLPVGVDMKQKAKCKQCGAIYMAD